MPFARGPTTVDPRNVPYVGVKVIGKTLKLLNFTPWTKESR